MTAEIANEAASTQSTLLVPITAINAPAMAGPINASRTGDGLRDAVDTLERKTCSFGQSRYKGDPRRTTWRVKNPAQKNKHKEFPEFEANSQIEEWDYPTVMPLITSAMTLMRLLPTRSTSAPPRSAATTIGNETRKCDDSRFRGAPGGDKNEPWNGQCGDPIPDVRDRLRGEKRDDRCSLLAIGGVLNDRRRNGFNHDLSRHRGRWTLLNFGHVQFGKGRLKGEPDSHSQREDAYRGDD